MAGPLAAQERRGVRAQINFHHHATPRRRGAKNLAIWALDLAAIWKTTSIDAVNADSARLSVLP
jgi:hypothetical protein